jgi:hypothetical protein
MRSPTYTARRKYALVHDVASLPVQLMNIEHSFNFFAFCKHLENDSVDSIYLYYFGRRRLRTFRN